MAPIRNGRVLFNSVPQAYPIPGETTVYDTSQTIDPDTVALNGGFLIKTLVLSVDPYFRGRMQHVNPKSAHNPFELGAPLDGFGVGVVVRSENTEVDVGNHIYGFTIQYSVITGLGIWLQILDKLPDLSWTTYLGAAGMPGQTAYAGWKEFSDAKEGEIAFVTTGAGPVGSMVIQLAKQAGMKVIAAAGSEEKVKFMQTLGADVAFNYKITATRTVLEKEGPIDVYWDNVGGEMLDAALEFSNRGARFLECGSISGYNTGHQGIKNMSLVGPRSLHIHGIYLADLYSKYSAEFYATIPAQVATGDIKHWEDISRGLDKVGDVILAVQEGRNRGKAVIIVAEE
ncbi:hypothetical protein C8R43DRAFT_1090963 [Mycena crocata]|nr:hypothetical protein C8R43DRAFT_1090963 [Mycena crocata]